ncbi:uncharacterized protein LOC135496365 isoform X2 [Lineus longissimus]|uniref:uncharacterized protein LOC135496365 isoform X2 n=1 Tax=Lineus longissimus TaxID=88925 RepID=UPI002B4C8C0B
MCIRFRAMNIMTCNDQYECTDGSCQDFAEFCRSTHPGCKPTYTRYWCIHEQLCRNDDTECLRPCGFRQGAYNYNVTCHTHGHRNLCARHPKHCPVECPFPNIHRCPSGDCVKNDNYCFYCPFKRCGDTGLCYSEKEVCDGMAFCQDNTDEKGCTDNSLQSPPYGSIDVDPWVLAILIGAGMFLLIIFTICCFRTRYGKRGRGFLLSGGRRTGRGISTILPGRAQLQTSLMMTPLAIDGLDTVFLYRDEMRRSNESPTENPSAAPPPSYTYVIQNDEKFKKPENQDQIDSGLPTYAEAVEILLESSNRSPP